MFGVFGRAGQGRGCLEEERREIDAGGWGGDN